MGYIGDDTGVFESEVLARFELIMSHLNWPSTECLSGKGAFASVHARDWHFTRNLSSMFHVQIFQKEVSFISTKSNMLDMPKSEFTLSLSYLNPLDPKIINRYVGILKSL